MKHEATAAASATLAPAPAARHLTAQLQSPCRPAVFDGLPVCSWQARQAAAYTGLRPPSSFLTPHVHAFKQPATPAEPPALLPACLGLGAFVFSSVNDLHWALMETELDLQVGFGKKFRDVSHFLAHFSQSQSRMCLFKKHIYYYFKTIMSLCNIYKGNSRPYKLRTKSSC